MRSMTGYGIGRCSEEGWLVEVEIKSVNHRYFSAYTHFPNGYNQLEHELVSQLKEIVMRGRVDIFVRLERDPEKEPVVKIDEALLKSYQTTINQIFNTEKAVNPEFILSLPGVLKPVTTPGVDDIRGPILQAFNKAVNELTSMQQGEGDKLKEELKDYLQKIEEIREAVKRLIPDLHKNYFLKLKEKITALVEDKGLDESRIAIEAGILAERSDVAEEMERLAIHVNHFSRTLALAEAIGKTLDFIAQEMQRELNTMGAKINDASLVAQIIEMKKWVERIREQTQNVL